MASERVFAGVSLFVWMVKSCCKGLQANSQAAWQTLCETARGWGLAYAPVKTAEGACKFNLSAADGGWQDDILPGLFAAFGQQGLRKVGWQYLYGANPLAEADTAALRIRQLGLQGYILDPETEYKRAGAGAARVFMRRLRQLVPNTPLALCSYRFPSLHRDFPWMAFLDEMDAARGDVHLPQMYWVGDERPNGPELQLERSLNELNALKALPLIPVGSAYTQQVGNRNWAPTAEQLENFFAAARRLGCTGASLWCWDSLAQKDDGSRDWMAALQRAAQVWGGAPPAQALSLEQRVERLEDAAREHGWDL